MSRKVLSRITRKFLESPIPEKLFPSEKLTFKEGKLLFVPVLPRYKYPLIKKKKLRFDGKALVDLQKRSLRKYYRSTCNGVTHLDSLRGKKNSGGEGWSPSVGKERKKEVVTTGSVKYFPRSPFIPFSNKIPSKVGFLYSLKVMQKRLTKKTKKRREKKKRWWGTGLAHTVQLRERRKLSLLYGNLSKKELVTCFEKSKSYRGPIGDNLLITLERRLDVLLYRIAFFKSILSARQWISHGRVQVNGQVITLGRYQMKDGDVFSLSLPYRRRMGNEILSRPHFLSKSAKKGNRIKETGITSVKGVEKRKKAANPLVRKNQHFLSPTSFCSRYDKQRLSKGHTSFWKNLPTRYTNFAFLPLPEAEVADFKTRLLLADYFSPFESTGKRNPFFLFTAEKISSPWSLSPHLYDSQSEKGLLCKSKLMTNLRKKTLFPSRKKGITRVFQETSANCESNRWPVRLKIGANKKKTNLYLQLKKKLISLKTVLSKSLSNFHRSQNSTGGFSLPQAVRQPYFEKGKRGKFFSFPEKNSRENKQILQRLKPNLFSSTSGIITYGKKRLGTGRNRIDFFPLEKDYYFLSDPLYHLKLKKILAFPTAWGKRWNLGEKASDPFPLKKRKEYLKTSFYHNSFENRSQWGVSHQPEKINVTGSTTTACRRGNFFSKSKSNKKQLYKVGDFLNQKTGLHAVLPRRTRLYGMKPLQVEVSYRTLTGIYLYSPQKMTFPASLDITAVKESLSL